MLSCPTKNIFLKKIMRGPTYNAIPLYKPPVVTCKPQETPQLSNSFRHGALLNCLDLSRISCHTRPTDHMNQVFYLWSSKYTLVSIHSEVVASQYLKYSSEVLNMIFMILVIYQDIIKEN
jgi:hypothetical protein